MTIEARYGMRSNKIVHQRHMGGLITVMNNRSWPKNACYACVCVSYLTTIDSTITSCQNSGSLKTHCFSSLFTRSESYMLNTVVVYFVHISCSLLISRIMKK